MRFKLKLYIWLLLVANLAACQGLDKDLFVEETSEYGNVELSFNGTTRATTTTISPADAQNFLITVTQGDAIIRGPERLGIMNMKFPAGQGYKVYAESCDKTEAETANGHWGKKRFVGSSAEFGINRGETTKVRVGMSVDNAAVSVFIDASMVNYFKNAYTLNVEESERNLRWNYDNASKNTEETGQVAYFNVGEDGIRTIRYTITSASGNNNIVKTGEITLSRAKLSRLKIAQAAGDFSFDVDVDQEMIYVNTSLNIGPGDVTSDDGRTDASAGNEDFDSDDTVPDYDKYN